MALTAFLDLRIKPDSLSAAHEMLKAILVDTRAFPGCLGVEVLIDQADPTHIVALESWESAEADAAYRAWRAGDGATELGTVLAAAPVLTVFVTNKDI